MGKEAVNFLPNVVSFSKNIVVDINAIQGLHGSLLTLV
jgi:hypothetical protein